MPDELTVRFRVGNVYRNCYISVYVGEKRILHKKKQIAAPGEMEEVRLSKKILEEIPGLEQITIKVEET